MADKTLKDVVEEIRSQGEMNGSMDVAVTELRGIKSNLQTLGETLNNTLKMGFGDLKKIIKSSSGGGGGKETPEERLRRERDTLTSNNDQGKRNPLLNILKNFTAGLTNTLKNFKDMLPKPGTLFKLILGGLLLALALFPDWIKRNIITPMEKMLDGFDEIYDGTENPKTTLGKIAKDVKDVFGWMNENIHPNAGWVVGAVGAAAVLKPGLLGAITGFTGNILKFARRHPMLTAASLAIGAFVTAMNAFRGESIETETKRVQDLKDKYLAAEKYEGPDRQKRMDDAAKEIQAYYDRIKDTAIGTQESIVGPIKEILASYDKINQKAKEATNNQLVAASEQAKNAKTDKEREEARAKFYETLRENEKQSLMAFKQAVDGTKNSSELMAVSTQKFNEALDQAGKIEDKDLQKEYLDRQLSRIDQAIKGQLTSLGFKKDAKQADLKTWQSQLSNALEMDADLSALRKMAPSIDAEAFNRKMKVEYTGADDMPAENYLPQRHLLNRMFNMSEYHRAKLDAFKVDKFGQAPEFGIPKQQMEEQRKLSRSISEITSQLGRTTVNSVSPVDARTFSGPVYNGPVTINNDSSTSFGLDPYDRAQSAFGG